MKKSKRILVDYITEVLDGFALGGSRRREAPSNLRFDVATTSQKNGNILTDVENEEQKELQTYPRASCCLITRDGKFLGVSRGIGSDVWAFPGGKANPGESNSDAAIRELYEETGLWMDQPREIFKRLSCGYITTTFIGRVSGKISSSEEGDVEWLDRSVLLDPEQSAFSDYAQAVFDRLHI